jgi:hypothetical protein
VEETERDGKKEGERGRNRGRKEKEEETETQDIGSTGPKDKLETLFGLHANQAYHKHACSTTQ